MARPRKTLPLLERVAAQGEQRLFPRKTGPVEVILVDEHGDPLLLFDADNVSVGGLLLRGAVPIRIGAHVLLAFTLPHHPLELRVTGEVVRAAAGGLGIRFMELDRTTHDTIAAWVQGEV